MRFVELRSGCGVSCACRPANHRAPEANRIHFVRKTSNSLVSSSTRSLLPSVPFVPCPPASPSSRPATTSTVTTTTTTTHEEARPQTTIPLHPLDFLPNIFLFLCEPRRLDWTDGQLGLLPAQTDFSRVHRIHGSGGICCLLSPALRPPDDTDDVIKSDD